MFLHGLQQSRLGLGRSAIDFVGQNQMSENRAPLKLELAPAAGDFHHDVCPKNVRGHQVRGELNATERQVEDFTESANQQGLAEARDPFQQYVSASKQGDKGSFDDAFVANHHFANLGAQRSVRIAEGLDLGFSTHFGGCRLRVAGCRFCSSAKGLNGLFCGPSIRLGISADIL